MSFQVLGGSFSSIGGVSVAKYYDGDNDYAERGADLTGIADVKVGLISFWFKPDNSGVAESIQWAAGTRYRIRYESDNSIRIEAKNSSLSLIFANRSTANSIIKNQWNHVMCSWDLTLANTKRVLYINNVNNSMQSFSWTNDTIDYTAGDFHIGAAVTTTKFTGCLGEVYLNYEEYLDLQVEANRRLFISNGGYPVSLGATGSTPTSNPPLVYLPDGDPANNKGTGGNLVVTGSLTTC